MNLPGLACIWASYSYTSKAYVQLATPIVVALFLAIPVPVARFCAQRAAAKKHKPSSHAVDTPDAAHEHEFMWKERYERTVDVFWNNIMVCLKHLLVGKSLKGQILSLHVTVMSVDNARFWAVLALYHLSWDLTHSFPNLHLPEDLS